MTARRFRENGIDYKPGAKPKSDLYVGFLATLNSRRVDLLENDRLLNQLVSRERRTARSGRDSIDHPPGAHDDLANVTAGVVAEGEELASNILQQFLATERRASYAQDWIPATWGDAHVTARAETAMKAGVLESACRQTAVRTLVSSPAFDVRSDRAGHRRIKWSNFARAPCVLTQRPHIHPDGW